ncbi:3-deoxy-manno-octulosonate-8-phosphatase KdsC [Glaciecola siphonariae]|uniref:3-deoxy-D-manno-octulosonate 8-phosphate phosphatase KdsC n=1 Tax=Glaciecola siphonariae TaxID=521012 RepID=A0ABV9M2Z0_9ALTE
MENIETLYGHVPASLFDACKSIRLLVLDVDGVLSDGFIYLGNHGEELKAFNSKDGYGVKALAQCGVDIAVITGRSSDIVHKRMQALNAKFIIQGEENKYDALKQLMNEHGLSTEQVASIGDDMPDLGLFELSAIKVAVSDAHPFVKRQANHITQLKGGRGAVREFCDLVLQAKGLLNISHGASM